MYVIYKLEVDKTVINMALPTLGSYIGEWKKMEGSLYHFKSNWWVINNKFNKFEHLNVRQMKAIEREEGCRS